MFFVLVHSPLVGASTWEPVAFALRGAGHTAAVPVLPLDAPGGGELWRAQSTAIAAAAGEAGPPQAMPWLVAHSGAGPLLPAARAALAAPVGGLIFVDAAMPHPGRSRFEALPPDLTGRVRSLARDGRVPPWNEWFPAEMLRRQLPDAVTRDRFVRDLESLPVRLFEEPLPETAAWEHEPCGYVQLSDAYTAAAAEAERRGWAAAAVAGAHLWPVTHSGEVAALIVELAERITREGR